MEKTVEYVCKLQQADGSFVGDKWGELNHVLLFMFSLNFPSKMCRGLEPNQNIAEINSYEHVVFHMN